MLTATKSEWRGQLLCCSEVLLLETESGRLAMRLEGHTAKVLAAKHGWAVTAQCRWGLCVSAKGWMGCDWCLLVMTARSRCWPSPVSSSTEAWCQVWSLTQRTLLYQSSIVSPWPFTSVAFDAHSNRLALGAADGAVSSPLLMAHQCSKLLTPV